MIRVLFVCVHNSARSQMAEAFLNALGGDYFQAESAGIEPGDLNPLAVQAMAEIGYDISRNRTDSVFEFFRQGRLYHMVICVCDPLLMQRCPVFPLTLKRLNWSFPDPSLLTGTDSDKLQQTRLIRDEIKAQVEKLIAEHQQSLTLE